MLFYFNIICVLINLCIFDIFNILNMLYLLSICSIIYMLDVRFLTVDTFYLEKYVLSGPGVKNQIPEGKMH